jgi:hypothetical protein
MGEKTKTGWTEERRAAWAERMKGPGNNFWKGGKTTEPRGYVLVKVGVGHHLADVRGYAYEHRLVAEEKLGRRLLPGEIAHHDDENKSNNRTDNIEPVASRAHHAALHRRVGLNNRLPGEVNVSVLCECGCGVSLLKFDKQGRPRRFVSGHNSRNQKGSFSG